jgi:hypothetical protein
VERPVLVEVRQAFEDHKRVVVGSIESVVRLQLLQGCHLVRSDGAQLRQVVRELSRCSIDRKVGVASKVGRKTSGVEDRELEGEMVQCGRGVAEAVPDDRPPFGERLLEALDPVDVLSAFTLYVMSEAVGIARKGVEFLLERVEVVASALALEPDTF